MRLKRTDLAQCKIIRRIATDLAACKMVLTASWGQCKMFSNTATDLPTPAEGEDCWGRLQALEGKLKVATTKDRILETQRNLGEHRQEIIHGWKIRKVRIEVKTSSEILMSKDNLKAQVNWERSLVVLMHKGGKLEVKIHREDNFEALVEIIEGPEIRTNLEDQIIENKKIHLVEIRDDGIVK